MSYEKTFGFEANEAFVELRFPNGTVVHIDREGVEADLLRHPRDQFLPDTLAFNTCSDFVIFICFLPACFLKEFLVCPRSIDNHFESQVQ